MTQQEQIYTIASELATSKRAIDIKRAMDLFESIPAYKDASSCAQACRERLEQLAQNPIEEVGNTQKFPRVAVLVSALCLLVVCIVGGIVASSVFGDKESIPANSNTPTYFLVEIESPTVEATETPFETDMLQPTEEPVWTPPPVQCEPLSPEVTVGSFVQFGTYKQGGDSFYEPIEWIVLDKQGDKALLLSRCGLVMRAYDTGTSSIWYKCELRYWLNTVFYSEAFTTEEKNKIQETLLPDDSSREIVDDIFVLSYDEYVKYNAIVDITKSYITTYATHGGFVEDCELNSGWWLRTHSNSNYSNKQIVIDCYGVDEDMATVDSAAAVRPAMWVSLG